MCSTSLLVILSCHLQARLVHPVMRTKLEVGPALMPSSIPLAEQVRTFETTNSVPILRRVNIPHAQTTPNIQSLTSLFRDITTDPLRHGQTAPKCRSCSLLHLSQSYLNHDALRGYRVEFVRVPLPDCIIIRLEALIASDRSRTPRLLAAKMLTTSSPLKNSLTGYNHCRLQFAEDQPVLNNSPELCNTHHQRVHWTLRQSIGLLLFCKVSLREAHQSKVDCSCFFNQMVSYQFQKGL